MSSSTNTTGMRRGTERTDDLGFVKALRKLFAELLGTCILTIVTLAATMIAAISNGQVSYVAQAASPGLVVMAMIYGFADTSGAHFNPAVSLAFAIRGVFPWRRVLPYWVAQLVGAVLGARLLRTIFGMAGNLGVIPPNPGVGAALAMEVILTCILLLIIIGTASRSDLSGPDAAIPVGATVALCRLFSLPVSGASMNPAVSLGQGIVSGMLDNVWIYIIGPFAGSLLAIVFVWMLRGKKQESQEGEAASGDEQQ